jgi:type I restriction enzyme, R subunit
MFDESNSVEALIRSILTSMGPKPLRVLSNESVATQPRTSWGYEPARNLPRATTDVLLESDLRDALVRLNPEIAVQASRADEVIYRLRAILVGVHADGLVKANEEFTAWLRGERSMPFGPNNEHRTVKLIDFDRPENNRFLATSQLIFKAGALERRFDLVLFVNGIPLVVGEAKSPVRPSVSWVDAAAQILDDYEVNVPAFFVPNALSFATEGKTFRFGGIRMPLLSWSPWRIDDEDYAVGLPEVECSVRGVLRPEVVLDVLRHFTLFATDKKHRKIKIICRYQQWEAANQIVERVVQGLVKKGLIWHFQGSGKSLLMVFAAQKLRFHPALHNPTVVVVVDRIDLDTQITATFTTADIPNLVTAESRADLRAFLAQDTRKIVITTIHKFGEGEGILNRRSNIVVMVDEAHRTQEGDLGRKMRAALPNAFFFGFTGTPINQRDHNTFWAFGAPEDERGYLSRYSFEDSIRDGATLPLHFEARLVNLRVDRQTIDEAFRNLTDELTDEDRDDVAVRASRLAVLLKSPARVRAIVRDIAQHFQEKVAPTGLKAQIVAVDREACVTYKEELDEILPTAASEVVISVGQSDQIEHRSWAQRFKRSRDDEEKLLDRFRDPTDPLQILIVTSRLLTGFDAPILQTMYLDKPMKDHSLIQAICRTNRPYPNKTNGLIVDYFGIFDDVATTLAFDDRSIQKVIANLDELKEQLPVAVEVCLAFFPGVDRTVAGYEGLIAAQECVPTDERRDAFALAYTRLSQIWEMLSPDPCLGPHEGDYRWISQVYDSVRPPSGNGKLLWHALGAKTIDLIHANVHVEAIRDDLETLILDADVLEEIAAKNDPTKPKEIEIKIATCLRRHLKNPLFMALGERLEVLRQRHALGQLTSLEFLKLLLALARDVVSAEKTVDPVVEHNRGKAALTELFQEARNGDTPVIVERVVNDIDEIVRIVRFPGWQQTMAGERDVQKALRRMLLKYQLHREQELFDRAYGYIREYY